MKKSKSQIIVACSDGNDPCPCPIAEIKKSEVTIKDDFGALVRMSKKQFDGT